MATRSPSPNPTRPTNPNPKTPESCNILRKSSSSNPSKPSISSESPRRNSCSKVGSPSLRSSFEQKENKKDPNFSKLSSARSPAVSSSKGTKNFMAPTISASSKAITASPRKKVLEERNEVISVTELPEFPRKEDIAPKSEMGSGPPMDEMMKMEEIRPKSDMGFGSEEIFNGSEPKKVNPEIKNHESFIAPSFSSSPIVAPLDADPSLPPYDPNTNYLSPRPKFLHYKPNPRIEDFLEAAADGKLLEDSFSSDISEDVTTSSERDSDEESSLSEEAHEESPDTTRIAEPEFEPRIYKSRPFKRSKLVPLLLVLAIACLYAPLSDSPIISSSISNDQTLGKPYVPTFGVFEDLQLREYITVASLNFHKVASRFRHWSMDYLTSFHSLPKEEFALLYLGNLTSSTADETVGLELDSGPETEPAAEQPIKENMVDEPKTSEAMEEDGDANHESEEIEIKVAEEVEKLEIEHEDETIEMQIPEDVKEFGAMQIEMEVSEDVNNKNFEEYELEEKIEEDGREEFGQDESDRREDLTGEESHHGNEAVKTGEEVGKEHTHFSPDGAVESEVMENQQDSSGIHSVFFEAHQIPHVLKSLESMDFKALLGVSLALAVLATTWVYLRMKQKQTPMATKEMKPPKKAGSVSGSSETCTPAKDSPYQYQVGDSGPSEVSSSFYNNTSSIGRRQAKSGKDEETLSHERKLRRDSAASSISYGSFTTYEKLSAKKGSRDDEVVTPVRRSSRIRNMVTSP